MADSKKEYKIIPKFVFYNKFRYLMIIFKVRYLTVRNKIDRSQRILAGKFQRQNNAFTHDD